MALSYKQYKEGDIREVLILLDEGDRRTMSVDALEDEQIPIAVTALAEAEIKLRAISPHQKLGDNVVYIRKKTDRIGVNIRVLIKDCEILSVDTPMIITPDQRRLLISGIRALQTKILRHSLS